jgi:hypothetical protein
MNERIQELAEQAIKSANIVTGNKLLEDELAKMYIPDCFVEKFAELIVDELAKMHIPDDCFVEKFAELIVRECANLANSESSYPYKDFGDKIRAHFGVE